MGVLKEGHRKARKNHWCDGWHWIEEDARELALEPCVGIKKGDEYYYQVNTYEGIGTFKCCKVCKRNADSNNLLMNDN
jgi:hypothetical protein